MQPRILSLIVPVVLPSCFNPFCFVEGTRVDTPRGPAPIEDLKVGDRVWSLSLEEGRRIARRVKATLRRRVREVRRICAGGRIVAGVTAEHPFYDPTRGGYRAVRDLREGDRLATFDDTGLRACPVESIAAREVADPSIEVFNLTIEGPEANYFAEGFLVHNKSAADPLCPDGSVTISEHAAPDASTDPTATHGDFDVTTTVDSESGFFSVLIMRDGDDIHAPPQLIERLSKKVTRARLIRPAPGNYDISAGGSLTIDGTFCNVLDVRRDFTILGADPDAGFADAAEEGD